MSRCVTHSCSARSCSASCGRSSTSCGCGCGRIHHEARGLKLPRIHWTGAMWLLLLAACAGDAGSPPYTPKLVVRSERDVVGCYKITSLAWDQPAPRLQHVTYEPPPTFFLSTELHPLGRRRIVTAGEESLYQYAGWQLAEGTTITALWRTAHGAVSVTVTRDERDPAVWLGTATRLTDRIASAGEIRMRQLSDEPCPSVQ
jgi:hypothetical protein